MCCILAGTELAFKRCFPSSAVRLLHIVDNRKRMNLLLLDMQLK